MPANSLRNQIWCLLVRSLVVEPGDDFGVGVGNRLRQFLEELTGDETRTLLTAQEQHARGDRGVAVDSGVVEPRDLLVLGEVCLEQRLHLLPPVRTDCQPQDQLCARQRQRSHRRRRGSGLANHHRERPPVVPGAE
jgi:hypothetical protein